MVDRVHLVRLLQEEHLRLMLVERQQVVVRLEIIVEHRELQQHLHQIEVVFLEIELLRVREQELLIEQET